MRYSKKIAARFGGVPATRIAGESSVCAGGRFVRGKGSRTLWRAACAVAMSAALVVSFPVAAFADCTQIYVPSTCTANGDRYVGRDEDGGTRYFKAFGVEPSKEHATYKSGETDFSWTSDKTSYRFTYVRDDVAYWDGRTDAYSANGVNEKGVSCSATLSTAMNDEVAAVDPLNYESGIGEYNYVSIVLGESATAREGAELLGKLVDEYGTVTNDQLTISDPDETWLFMTLSGHQWLAMKMPEDQVSVNPNMSNLRFEVDLDDADSCLHSEGVLDVAKEAETLTYFEDGTPDLAGSYGVSDGGQGAAQNTRYGQGRAYFEAPLSAGRYTMGQDGIQSIDEPELFFEPGRSNWSTFDILRSLAARGEQTDNLNANENESLYAIGNSWQMEGHMFEIREDLPSDIATIQWLALSRTEFSVAVPLYSALITEASPYFCDVNMDTSHAGSNYNKDSVELAMQEEPEDSLDYVFMDINTLCYNNRSATAEGMRAYLDALQKQLIEQNEAVDAAMRSASPDERTELANRAEFAAVEATYDKAKTALDELRAYLKTRDASEPFVPSDYDPETGDLKTPIAYASAVVAPVIDKQPASATYEQGAKASDLTVSASLPDGVEGDLTYEWFVKDADAASEDGVPEGYAKTGVEAASMPVDTSKVGEQTFVCRVSDDAGLYVDSEPATITVVEAAEKDPIVSGDPEDDGPKDESNEPDENGPVSEPDAGDSSSLAQTGDPLSGAPVLGVAIVAAAAAVVARKKIRNS